MKSILSTLIILIYSFNSFSQTVATFLDWVKGYEHTLSGSPSSIAVDTSGNVFITGNFDDSLIVNNEVFDTYEFEIFDNNDGFVMKLDKFGELIWFKHIMSNSGSSYITSQTTSSIVIDNNNDLIIVGSFFSSFKVDGETQSAISSSNGESDCYILKLSTEGSFIWVKRIGGSGVDGGGRVAIDSENNVYIPGSFNLTVDFNPEPGVNNVENLTSLGVSGGLIQSNNDAFLLKLNSNGLFVWVKHFSGSKSIVANSVVIDKNDDAIVSGQFLGTCHFVGVNGSFLYALNNTYSDRFVTKINQNGEFVWIKEVNASNIGNVFVSSTFVDSDGAIYTTGSFRGAIDFDSGTDEFIINASIGTDIYIDKVDTEGNFVWAKSMKGVGAYAYGACVWLDLDKDIYLSGLFRDSVDFDPGSDERYLTPVSSESMFLLKLNNNGEFKWVKKTEGFSYAGPVTVDSEQNILFFGAYYGSVKFNDFESDTILNKERGMYLMKLKQVEDAVCCDNDEIIYYPNPTSDFVYFNTNKLLFISVSDLNGKIIKEIRSNSVSLVDLSGGIYFLSLYDEEDELIEVVKIIKY